MRIIFRNIKSIRKHLCSVNHPTIKLWIMIALVFSVASLLFLTFYVDSFHFNSLVRRSIQPSFKCQLGSQASSRRNSSDYSTATNTARLRLDPKILVFVETQYSRNGKEILSILQALRMKFKIEFAGKSLPLLTKLDKGKYAVIIFEDYYRYLQMDKWNRELLDKYCREYNVGIIGIIPYKEDNRVGCQLKGFPLYIQSNVRLKDYQLNADSSVLRITRAGQTAFGFLPGDWTVFHTNHSTYSPVSVASPLPVSGVNKSTEITVIQDKGEYDGIQRILYGQSMQFWIHRLLFIDSLSHLSHGKLSLPLVRYMLVDIDDIFVGEKGTRMTREDVMALIECQNRLRQLVPGFRYNLGFSGKFIHRGSDKEDDGDNAILENRSKFWWFPHMWNHMKPHLFDNRTKLEQFMRNNKKFAEDHGIPTDSGYAVAPHHSGVYPVHEQLYYLWKKIWNVRVTSTEEYPHLKPARLRRGFIHRNIMVLPRQTCGLYTHTIFMDHYPGGRQRLENMIQGGELFQTIVINPINIFMTHLSNYANDRLAIHTFESVIKFVQCWTNLQLYTIPPLQLAEKYFKRFPEEANPVWSNPCDDKRHFAIWSSTKSCDKLPKFLVIGPQKTGTTALYTFFVIHPAIASSYPSRETFEEIQFLNGKNYFKGLDWYMNFFPIANNSTGRYLFEKSATYFDSELVPMRAHALLPHAKLITILINPAKRAYSWYQHMRSHHDPVALSHSFYEVVTANENASRPLRDIRNRCLIPGMYAQHLDRWLSYYPSNQLLIVDGVALKSDPISVMNNVQKFLNIKPYFDYSRHLKYNPSKGFFCQVLNNNRTKCLGRSKGRAYPPMDQNSDKFLRSFYRSHNVALSRLLTKLGQPIPNWLSQDLAKHS